MSFWGSFSILLGLGRSLLAGTLPLRYCAARFACRTTTWQLPVLGRVVDLVAHMMVLGETILLLVFARRFVGFVVLVRDGKEIDLTKKNPAHLSGLVFQSRPRVWKRLHSVETFCVSLPDPKRKRCDQEDQVCVLAQDRTGVG